jgi:fructuronate reductase
MPRIVHFGPGNFHRAHQAWYTQNAGGWSITGVSLRSTTMRDAMAGQGYDYTLVMQDAQGSQDQQITVHDQILVGPEDPAAVIAAIADPDTHIVTATVTEKGYGLDAAGALDLNGPVGADITAPLPATFIGYLARGIAARQKAGALPLTVISCDNLSHNGDKVKSALNSFAQAADLSIDFGLLRFPNTMVDRITPAPTEQLSQEVSARIGKQDAAPVVTEVFSEWVITDDFAGPRPDWPDVQIVEDVVPFEMRKLRMLNGAHSTLAYLGQLKGYSFVHEAIGDPALRADVVKVMEGAMATLGFSRADLEAYRDALIARFENPSLAHALRQIAMDGSQKVPIRLLDVMGDLQKKGGSFQAHARAVAAWCRYVDVTADLDDPMADALSAAGSVSGYLMLIAPDCPAAIFAAIDVEYERLSAEIA